MQTSTEAYQLSMIKACDEHHFATPAEQSGDAAAAASRRRLCCTLVAACILLCIIFSCAVGPSELPIIHPSISLHHTYPATQLLVMREHSAQQHAGRQQQQQQRCHTLPHLRALLHSWLTYETHAALTLLHSIAASLVQLMQHPDTAAAQPQHALCALAHDTLAGASNGRHHHLLQSDLFFDIRAQRYWTQQRTKHASHWRPVWLPELLPGDCLVCSKPANCARRAATTKQLRQTMAHAPSGWSMVHLHECQTGQEATPARHPHVQEFKNECRHMCEQARSLSLSSAEQEAAHMSCHVCMDMDASVDASAHLLLGVLHSDLAHTREDDDDDDSEEWNEETDIAGWSEQQLVVADRMLSALFERTTARKQWATAADVAPLDDLQPSSESDVSYSDAAESDHHRSDDVDDEQATHAFFLDWTCLLYTSPSPRD